MKIVNPTESYTSDVYYIDLLHPESYKFKIKEIASSLSKINRFTGGTKFPYSVALHSIYVSMLVSPRNAKAALLHDASEAYIGDFISPVKNAVPALQLIEDNIQSEIYKQFNLIPDKYDIRQADMTMLEIERKLFFPESLVDHWYDFTTLLDFNIDEVDCYTAEKMFLLRWYDLNDG